jgi:hypothetical protein
MKFIDGTNAEGEIKSLLSNAKHVRIAVAYWGREVVERLGLSFALVNWLEGERRAIMKKIGLVVAALLLSTAVSRADIYVYGNFVHCDDYLFDNPHIDGIVRKDFVILLIFLKKILKNKYAANPVVLRLALLRSPKTRRSV